MNGGLILILFGIGSILIIGALLIFAPKHHEDEEVDASAFEPLNGSYVDFDDFRIISDSVRLTFRNQNRPKKYFQMLDVFEDKFWIKTKVREHYSVLKRNTERRLKKNDYGAVVEDGRSIEILEFLRSVKFSPKILDADAAVQTTLDVLHEFSIQIDRSDFDPSTIPESGIEFESWVADNLRKFGWNATSTQGSGDQGLDVIAIKNGRRVGIQCKLYSSNVGNKAVQEIHAAKKHFDLDKVAVLTNAGYTKSARELAQTCDVLLLSHYDIPRFDELFLDF